MRKIVKSLQKGNIIYLDTTMDCRGNEQFPGIQN